MFATVLGPLPSPAADPDEAVRTVIAAQEAANRNDSVFTIGICACEPDGTGESTQGRWKKFHVNNDTTMSVTFNTVPGTPTSCRPR